MLKNHVTAAWRTLVRNKVYSLVNVLGLAFGICACLVIYLITRYEYSFDTFHPDNDRIFCVDFMEASGGHFNCVPGAWAAAMRREMTGLQTVAGFHTYSADVTIPGDRNSVPEHFSDDGSLLIAEPQYFDIFQYRWLSGNAATALNLPNSVVLTAEKAQKYFGNLAPDKIIGRTVCYQDSLMMRVTGIVAGFTGNSDLNFSQWISFATIPVSFLKSKVKLDDWRKIDGSTQVMVKLAKGVAPSQIDTQFVALAKRHYGKHPAFAAILQPLSGIHFHEEYGGFVERKASLVVMKMLTMVAVFILILAIVNFVNLSTAQSMQRAREIGVRKVLGGSRMNIAVKFFTETLLLTIAAVVLAVLMIRPVFYLFADLIPAGVYFRMDGGTLLFLLLVTAATTLLAGFYPARVLGKYQPTVTLKGITAVPDGGKGELRRVLIVFQFTISLLFIIASFIMGSQLRYMLHKNVGIKTDAIITITPPLDHPRSHGVIMEPLGKQRKPSEVPGKMAVLADKIRQHAGVMQVIKEGAPPVGFMRKRFFGGGLKNSYEKIRVSLHYSNDAYAPFYGMKLIAGRNLLPGDSSRELLISEQCAHALGFADVNKAIGQEVFIGEEAYPVAGVVADFYDHSFHQSGMPIIISHDPGMEIVIGVKIAAQRMTAAELKTLIGNFEKDWKTVFPGQPFNYSFLNDIIAGMYADDLRNERVINVAMGITAFISCLGLLGLTIFSTERRGREIGIRKVLGATVTSIMIMLCKEIVLLIGIALLIVTPLALYLMYSWLQSFAYRTPFSFLMFIAAGAATIGIALLTVGLQAMKAAMANPVKKLRTE